MLTTRAGGRKGSNQSWHNEGSMTQKSFCCGILIAILCFGLVQPARAANPEKVLIIITATTVAAVIVLFVAISRAQHRRKKIVITGCIVTGENGMTVADEEDGKHYLLSGNTAGIKPGERMILLGKKVKPQRPDRTLVWETKDVVKDLGVCRP
jgi:hypothetical protein